MTSLFDEDELPRARNSDPATSHKAGRSVRGRGSYIAILRTASRAKSPLCSEEIADLNGWTKDSNCYWKRVSECYQAGWLEPQGTRRASTGREQQAYVITDQGRTWLRAN